MKGGKIFKVIDGKRKDKYALAPNVNQSKEFAQKHKLYVLYFEDEGCNDFVIEKDLPVEGLTDFKNLKLIGFYD